MLDLTLYIFQPKKNKHGFPQAERLSLSPPDTLPLIVMSHNPRLTERTSSSLQPYKQEQNYDRQLKKHHMKWKIPPASAVTRETKETEKSAQMWNTDVLIS